MTAIFKNNNEHTCEPVRFDRRRAQQGQNAAVKTNEHLDAEADADAEWGEGGFNAQTAHNRSRPVSSPHLIACTNVQCIHYGNKTTPKHRGSHADWAENWQVAVCIP